MSSQMRLFVGGIPSGADTNALRDSFSPFGHVVACELKSKPSDPDNQFAFITIAADQRDVDSCLRHFSQEDWHGCRLHVTRARESFLERLQKERTQAQTKKQTEIAPIKEADNFDVRFKIKTPELTNLNIKKPEYAQSNGYGSEKRDGRKPNKNDAFSKKAKLDIATRAGEVFSKSSESTKKQKFTDEKKLSSDNKRLESMRKMRKEFNDKKLMLKSGLAGVDKATNKRIKFDDESTEQVDGILAKDKKDEEMPNGRNKKTLFDDNDDDDQDDVNFKIKEQFEGKKGQKTLELQSRFKSDKRFNLDERFIEDEEEAEDARPDDEVQVLGKDEKARQMSILQNVLGVAIKSSHTQPENMADNKKTRTKLAMLRFDPNHPDHAKFLAPSDTLKKDIDNNSKRKKGKRKEETVTGTEEVEEKVEVSKEQFYKVSDTLKEAIAQPNSFSLRSLFSTNQTQDEHDTEKDQDTGYTPLVAAKKDKVKNPFDKKSKNPFKYDSSDSEPEPEDADDAVTTQKAKAEDSELKAVWREKLFFSKCDSRFKEGLAFFNNSHISGTKERRELKSLVKKRLYNRSRKDQMFQKKIGGKRKNFNNKNRKQKQ